MYRGIIAISTLIIAVISWIAVLSYPSFFTERKQSQFPTKLLTFLILGTLFFSPVILNFCKIAYQMWESKVNAGSAGYEELSLAGAHAWFIVMLIILVIVLLIRAFKHNVLMPWFSISGSIIFILCMNISFFYTIPRKGSEGLALWLFLEPGFILADLILILTIIIFSVINGIRKIHLEKLKFQQDKANFIQE